MISEEQYESNENVLLPTSERDEDSDAESRTENHSYNHAMEENVHHGMSFILHLHLPHQQTIQPSTTNVLVLPFLQREGNLAFQFKERNECCAQFV